MIIFINIKQNENLKNTIQGSIVFFLFVHFSEYFNRGWIYYYQETFNDVSLIMFLFNQRNLQVF
mgnify:CR=1 FL=1